MKHLENSRLASFNFKLLALLMLGWMFDSMTAGLVSFLLKPIVKEWELTPEIAGIMLSAWLWGMLVGAFIMGSLGDIVGRKMVMMISLVIYSLPTFTCSFINSWLEMSILRFLAGIGSSGFMVLASTLLAEYTPAKKRGMFITILESSWALGWLLASFLAFILAPEYGWRIVFLSAFTPIFLTPVYAYLVPESLRYLAKKGRIEEVEKLLKKFSGMKELKKISLKGKEEKIPIGVLFKKKYLHRTIMLWIHWFCIVFSYWGIFLWLPGILYDRGLSLVKSLQYSFVITLIQIPGYWSAAYLIEKLGRKKTLALYMTLAGIGSLFFWFSATNMEALLWGSVISFFNLGAWGVTYAYTPELYPTEIRSTGSGLANSIGRIGGILGPITVGFIASLTGSYFYVFTIFALAHFISAFTVLILGIETAGKILEEI